MEKIFVLKEDIHDKEAYLGKRILKPSLDENEIISNDDSSHNKYKKHKNKDRDDKDDEDKDDKKSKKEKKEKKEKKIKKEKKSKKEKKHKKSKKDKHSSNSDSDSSSSSDEGTKRSVITGKKIKMSRDLSTQDRLNEIERAAKRHYMNSQF